VYAVLLKDGAHRVVAPDLALVVGVLQVALLDVLPDLLDGLRSGELQCVSRIRREGRHAETHFGLA
jgi:hypothetical protein